MDYGWRGGGVDVIFKFCKYIIPNICIKQDFYFIVLNLPIHRYPFKYLTGQLLWFRFWLSHAWLGNYDDIVVMQQVRT